MATKSADKARRKFKFERQMGRILMNPVVAALDRIGIRSSLVVDLETTGRKSGEPRRVPLAGRADETGVCGDLPARPSSGLGPQHLRRSARAHTDEQPNRHTRTATFEPDDDVRARARSFGGNGRISQSATALTMRAMESDPISVRITFDD